MHLQAHMFISSHFKTDEIRNYGELFIIDFATKTETSPHESVAQWLLLK